MGGLDEYGMGFGMDDFEDMDMGGGMGMEDMGGMDMMGGYDGESSSKNESSTSPTIDFDNSVVGFGDEATTQKQISDWRAKLAETERELDQQVDAWKSADDQAKAKIRSEVRRLLQVVALDRKMLRQLRARLIELQAKELSLQAEQAAIEQIRPEVLDAAVEQRLSFTTSK